MMNFGEGLDARSQGAAERTIRLESRIIAEKKSASKYIYFRN
jgi:hypothetical protein